MADSIEDLLAQIKAEYGNAESNSPNPDPAQSGAAKNPDPAQSGQGHSAPSHQLAETPFQPSGSIDNLLVELEGRSTPTPDRSTSPFSQSSLPSTQQPYNPPFNATASTSETAHSSTNNLLEQLKTQYQEQDQLAERQRQQQLREEQHRQAQVQQQRRAAIVQQAEAWLKALDPRGGEGAWFEEFAAKYDSRLEAAIDYLGLDDLGLDDLGLNDDH